MDLSKKILLATTNKGKIKEIKQILEGVDILTLLDLAQTSFEVEENGRTFKDNALIKAKAYAEKFNHATLADDSGLEVDALSGRPGVQSARYAGVDASDAERVKKLLVELESVPYAKRTARFKCVICVYDPFSKTNIFSEGVCQGHIGTISSGANGFGYDPIFIPEGFECTMAELLPEQKNKISHRGRALRALKEKILHSK